ncbi:5-oxoprolinase subunit PxpB [Pontibacillus yanchengensis]|uniref:Kinase inhibitor n=1 Tax=Pontibacillus yanchengensis Y32 TaxID=1385514 RepID=A0A0A2T555_9BACI|nr:5-oxoprolinase subunit PxpB [Pontibacillus yanchengensis]KGP70887.1 kinase inhibitor [Pontibacillus yanchengensis Y32]
MNYTLTPLGDRAIVIELGNEITIATHNLVQSVVAFLDQHPFDWITEYIPAFTTVTIFYNPLLVLPKTNQTTSASPYEHVVNELIPYLDNLEENHSELGRTIEIPVCYGGELGPDLPYVAEYHNLSEEQIVDLHSKGDYLVYMIGFAPGFPYIGGMPEDLATPRKDNPRLKIPAGSVGIAGNQTGVYPIETPGGWQLIGRTPLPLFDPELEPPTLLKTGDVIRFKPITKQEFDSYKEDKA